MNQRFAEVNRRLDGVSTEVNRRLDDMKDLLKSEVKRLEDRISPIHRA